ncbi:DUF6484 domain-containing protein [Burkholderia ubonensis]|uniref:DUF6484 domain-containing protein n=1 Tax=Burkholderia ubonensis subsp. mesacidophila TaxID=265293 RepID=A0A2A4FJK5_9BURK|nr:DUF6484 domain-containing protein [Burkholderia ubonensis]PCE33257.1 hypothetical protein BZL54_05960 [Burkholderia ubonensis subsp. mesacidophila]
MGLIEKFQAPATDARPRGNDEITLGAIASVSADGNVFVDYPDNPVGRALHAVCAARIEATAVGRRVALLFVQGDPARPIVLGLIRQASVSNGVSAEIINGSVVFHSAHELSFRCGASSLSMSSDGRVVVRGKYIASYADGTQRIRGATVEIN